MKNNARNLDGVNDVGDVVQIPVHKVNQTKVGGQNITTVVVEVLKGGQVRCACIGGVLVRPYARH